MGYGANLKKDGAESRTRTDDLLITDQLLYQLSYFGMPVEIVPLRPPSVKFRANFFLPPPWKTAHAAAEVCNSIWIAGVCSSVL